MKTRGLIKQYKCIKNVYIGKAIIFTAGRVYVSEHKNCLTSDTFCKYTIVMNNKNFDFDSYFKLVK